MPWMGNSHPGTFPLTTREMIAVFRNVARNVFTAMAIVWPDLLPCRSNVAVPVWGPAPAAGCEQGSALRPLLQADARARNDSSRLLTSTTTADVARIMPRASA